MQTIVMRVEKEIDDMYFYNRKDAGEQLGKKLAKKYQDKDIVVYALPRGGVVTGIEVARALNAPLELIITRKIGHPFQPEFAIAATAENGHMVRAKSELKLIDQKWLKETIKEQQHEAKRRRELYLGKKKSVSVEGKTAILVDDGIATGLTMKMAVRELKHRHPGEIVIAVPVAPQSVADSLNREVDEFVSLDTPSDEKYAGGVGGYYEEFLPVTDKEVVTLMHEYIKEQEKPQPHQDFYQTFPSTHHRSDKRFRYSRGYYC